MRVACHTTLKMVITLDKAEDVGAMAEHILDMAMAVVVVMEVVITVEPTTSPLMTPAAYKGKIICRQIKMMMKTLSSSKIT